MKMQTRQKLAVLGAATIACAGVAATTDAATLLDEDFQSPIVADSSNLVGTIGAWTGHATNVKTKLESNNSMLSDNDNATNQGLYLEWNGTGNDAHHDLSYGWQAGDVFQISFNANSTAWSIQNQRWVLPRIVETGSGDVLWEAPSDAASELFWFDTVGGTVTNPYAWNGAGPYGNMAWQDADQDDVFFSFTVNADDFTLGTAGSNIELQLDSAGQRGVAYDNVLVTVNEVIPEPSSLALLGLGGLMMVKRRRRHE